MFSKKLIFQMSTLFNTPYFGKGYSHIAFHIDENLLKELIIGNIGFKNGFRLLAFIPTLEVDFGNAFQCSYKHSPG